MDPKVDQIRAAQAEGEATAQGEVEGQGQGGGILDRPREAWLSCSDVAGLMGLSSDYIAELCQNGDFPGAVSRSRGWYIPSRSVAYCRKRRKLDRVAFARVVGRAYERIDGVDKCPASCRGRTDYDCLAEDKPCLEEGECET